MRVFLIVLDSMGIGFLPDAYIYGDKGANTLKSISKSNRFNIPNLLKLGLGNIDGVDFLEGCENPEAAYGRCGEKSKGKDTTTGHWEIAGLVTKNPFPTFPDGFPKEITEKFSEETGRGILCNKPYSGTEVIRDYGQEHIESGKLIVYTSADSVFQIAAHEDIVSREELYKYCRIAREMLVGKYGVGRVIARPFKGESPEFQRSDGRHDFSLEPTGETMLDKLHGAGKSVISVGKINDIFAGRAISRSYPTKNNKEGIERVLGIAEKDFEGLCFANLVDFDMVFGHRRDRDGYAEALSYFDSRLPEIIERLRSDDILIITADHGCDPSFEGTDHTREYVPVIMYGEKITPVNLGTRESFADIGATVAMFFNAEKTVDGESFSEVVK